MGAGGARHLTAIKRSPARRSCWWSTIASSTPWLAA